LVAGLWFGRSFLAKNPSDEQGVSNSGTTSTAITVTTATSTSKGILVLTGTVQSVGSGKFTMNVSSSFRGVENNTRNVAVTATTEYLAQTPKDPKQYSAELAAAKLALQKGSKTTGPLPYFETKASFSDIKSGTRVAVLADHDISTEKSFTATTVTIYPASPTTN